VSEPTKSQRETLEKSIPFSSYIGVGLGAIIGIGWLMYSGQWLLEGGPAGAMLAFFICGLLLIPIGESYAELTSSIPVAGGELAFAYKAFGPLPAFLTAWAVALSYTAITPFETIAIGALFEAMAPSMISDQLYQIGGYRIGLSTIIPGLLSGIFLIWLNIRGVASSTRVQLWIVSALAACSAVFIVTALFKGDVAHLTPMFANGGSWAAAPASIISVLVVAPYFMAGFDTIPQAAEESGVNMKPRQLGVAILACIVLGALFYVLIILAVAMSVSQEQLQTLMKQNDVLPTAEVFRVAFHYEWAARLVMVAALLGLISTLNGFYIASSRLLFSLGRGGLLPHWFAKVHDKHQTPSNAVLFVGAISLLGPFIGKSALIPIVNSGALTFAVTLLMTCLAAVRLRFRHPEMPRPFRANTLSLYAGIAVSALLVLLMTVPQSPGFLKPLEFLIIGGWMAFGLAGYIARRAMGDISREERDQLILGDY